MDSSPATVALQLGFFPVPSATALLGTKLLTTSLRCNGSLMYSTLLQVTGGGSTQTATLYNNLMVMYSNLHRGIQYIFQRVCLF